LKSLATGMLAAALLSIPLLLDPNIHMLHGLSWVL
jgi:hypothetical protein